MAKRKKTLNTNFTIKRRTLFLMSVCGIVAFVVLAVQLFKVQIIEHEKYEKQAISQQTQELDVSAERGTIYDRNGKVLAMSATVDTVFISPVELNEYMEDPEFIADNLYRILGVNRGDIIEKYKDTGSWYKTVARKIETDVGDRVREFISEYELKSVHVEPDTKRYYPSGSLACHVVGFVGDDNYGLEGLEARYDEELTGSKGRIVRLKSRNGVDMLFTDFENYYDGEDGYDVVLTLDETIQHIAEKYLAQAIKDYDVLNGGACIIMNPNSGEIYAMASMGNYDLNNFMELSPEVKAKLEKITDPEEKEAAELDALYSQWRNKALSDTYEPGSVFKIVTMATAIESGSVTEADTFGCEGAITGIPGRDDPLNCWNPAGHGIQTLRECLKNSCNCAFVQIGMKIGAETFYEYMENFGFFDTTNIDLAGEAESLWWDEDVFFDPYNKSQLASATFGQTFNITPLQMITAVSAVVNGGNLMTPYIVEKIVDTDGNIVKATEPNVVRQVISRETSDIMCDYLESVVSSDAGTSKSAYVAGYRVGGKTGTSEKVSLLAQGTKENIASFCGVAPCDDPQVVCLLLLDNPNPETGLYISGSSMAAPTVGQIFTDVLPYLGIEPKYTDKELEYIDHTVPNVKNADLDSAISLLETEGFDVEVEGDGNKVLDQLPKAGHKVAAGSNVILYTEKGYNTETVTVPDLYGESYDYAKFVLEDMGLYIRSTGVPTSTYDAYVSNQTVEAGTSVSVGTVIGVTLVDSGTLAVR